MAKDLDFPIDNIVCTIVREADGLAMSSRNAYLSPTERKAATVLYRALTEAQTAFQQGEWQAENLRAIMKEVISREPLSRLQYISCADPESLEELYGQVRRAMLSIAVYVGKTRLIDNLIIEKDL
jgi:pantoate--beta-alanine ligase